MEDLVKDLEKAHPAINWFALGEAIYLASLIKPAIEAYNEDEETHKFRIINLAKAVADYLTPMSGGVANKSSRKLLAHLDRLKAEGEYEDKDITPL